MLLLASPEREVGILVSIFSLYFKEMLVAFLVVLDTQTRPPVMNLSVQRYDAPLYCTKG